MKSNYELTAIIEREGDGYVSLCPDLDIASQGDTIEEARANLIEALYLFLRQLRKKKFQNKSLNRKCFNQYLRYSLATFLRFSEALLQSICVVIKS